MAVITTEWRYHSHAWHMAERFLVGYPINGRWHRPPFDVVSAYVDQNPDNDLSRKRSAEFGFPIFPTVAEALRCGGKELAVDAVLIIGEHGEYPKNEYRPDEIPALRVLQAGHRRLPQGRPRGPGLQRQAPVVEVGVGEGDGRHLARAGVPVPGRLVAAGDVADAVDRHAVRCRGRGDGLRRRSAGVDSYDFHALETIQCMAERRRGGETGVVAVQGLRGDAVWKAMDAGGWDAGGWDPRLFEACLSRARPWRSPPTFSDRYPTAEQMREWVKDPVAYRIEYADGTQATMLLMNGLVGDFTFAARLKGQAEPLSTLFYLPPNPNVIYSAMLMSKAEEMFLTGRPPYPIERTLLTTGLVAAVRTVIGDRAGPARDAAPGDRLPAPRDSLFAHMTAAGCRTTREESRPRRPRSWHCIGMSSGLLRDRPAMASWCSSGHSARPSRRRG